MTPSGRYPGCQYRAENPCRKQIERCGITESSQEAHQLPGSLRGDIPQGIGQPIDLRR